MSTRNAGLRLAALLCTFLLLPYAVQAQSATLSGTVLAASDGTPLPGAHVELAGTPIGTTTDGEGTFSLTRIEPGTYALRASFVGFDAATQEVTLTAGSRSEVEIRLAEKSFELSGIEVAALRPTPDPVSDLDESAIRRLDADDTGRLIRAMPGLSAARRGALGLDPNVRGLTETEVGTYIDGVRTFPAGPLRMDSQLSHTDPATVRRVEVVKGPYALTWGAGNMSAIRVTTIGDAPPRGLLNGSVSTGYSSNAEAWETAGTVAGTAGRIGYAVHGAFRQGTDYDAGNDELVEADYRSASTRAQVNVQVAPRHRVSVNGNYQDQRDIDYPGRLLNAEYFRSGSGNLRYEYDGDGLLQGVEAQGYAFQTLHGMTNEGKPTYVAGTFPDGSMRPPLRIDVDTELRNVGGRMSAEFAPTGALRLKVGGDVYHALRDAVRPLKALMNGMEMTPPFYDSEQIWPGVEITDAGVYLQARSPAGPVNLSATSRVDFVRADLDAARVSETFLDATQMQREELGRAETNWSGAFTAALPINANLYLSAGVGSVVRSADALERYADRIPASKAQMSAEFVGNPDLAPERSTQADLWLEAAYPTWSLQVNTFVRRMTDYITLEEAPAVSPLLPLSPSTVYRYVNGTATFAGADLTLGWKPVEALMLTAQGSYLWGRDEGLDEPAFGVMPPSVDLSARWTMLREAGFARDLYLQSELLLVAEQERVATARGERPTDSYATLDLMAGMQLYDGVSFRFGVRNVTDVAYANHLNARNPFSAEPIYETGRSLHVNLRWTW